MEAFNVFDALLNGDLTGLPSLFTNATGFHYYFNYLNTEYVKIVVMMMPRKQNMLSHFTVFLGACETRSVLFPPNGNGETKINSNTRKARVMCCRCIDWQGKWAPE